MYKQLFISIALASAFAATPVLADDHKENNKDDPEWEQKVNKTENGTDKNQNDASSSNMNEDNSKKMDKDDPEWDQKINKTEE